MKKKFLFACAVAAAAVFLAACGGGNSAQGSGGGDMVTLRVLFGQSTTDTGIENLIDAALAKKYPEVRLDWECVGWNDLYPKIQVYLQSGLPDIIIGKGQDISVYGTAGILADLTGKPYLSEVMDSVLPGDTLDGKVYGLTCNALYQGVYYSREIFSRLGLEVPTTLDELNHVIEVLEANGITPFATHFADSWSILNLEMQFGTSDVFTKNPTWGDDFRAGLVSFAASPEWRGVYEYFKLLYDHTWTAEAFSIEQTTCDARMVLGQAAMKVSGAWSIQNFLDIDDTFDFGIFPFPNLTGDAKLLFEPNLTFMASATSQHLDAVDKVLEVIGTDKDLALEISNFTKASPTIRGITPTFPNPSQSDIDSYAAAGQVQDYNVINRQLRVGGFQEENAKDIAEYMQGKITIDAALEAADSRRANSSI